MTSPLITVGLVVHNGDAYLGEAIQSFLNQTFCDFELLICDNGSTDTTAQIISEYADRDPRIRVVRHSTNIGSLRNWIYAVDHAHAPYFCWAAHDDLREPDFLETLVNSLNTHRAAAMACCSAQVIDPNGERQHILQDTSSFQTSVGMTSTERVRMYLRGAPASPIFGLYRTAVLRDSINVFRRAAANGGPLMLWLDIAFLTEFFHKHEVAVIDRPLFLFRRGGVSHRIDHYKSMLELSTALWQFWRLLGPAIHDPNRTRSRQLRLTAVAWRYYCRTIFSAPVRRMIWHHVSNALPKARALQAHYLLIRNPAYRHLRRRLRREAKGTRIVIFGAGKHTRRCYELLRRAIDSSATLVAFCDDAAATCEPIESNVVLPGMAIRDLKPDIVLVSSDTYERALFQRAREITGSSTDVWCIYDTTLEHRAIPRSDSSIDEMNEAIVSMTSSPLV